MWISGQKVNFYTLTLRINKAILGNQEVEINRSPQKLPGNVKRDEDKKEEERVRRETRQARGVLTKVQDKGFSAR